MSHKATLWAIEQRGLKPTTKIILWHLCDRFNPDYGCFPSQKRLALDCEISRSTLNEHLDKLEAFGLLRRVPRIDPATKRQMATRYILGFEEGFASGATVLASRSTNGETSMDGGDEHLSESPSQADVSAEPCPETTHGNPAGPVSGFCPDPCPENAQSRVRNPDTNLVREPLREPVKEEEEEDAQAREIDFDRFFAELLRTLGFEPEASLPAWWQGWPARTHVRRWVEDLGLSEDRIIEVATATRDDHPAPPDGPKALDRAMERAARQDAQTDAGQGRSQKPRCRSKSDPTPMPSMDDRAAFCADLVNSDRYLPPSAITNTMRDAMLARRLVTADQLRQRGVK
ncbi:helix-turn-helix domain-containing protein [Paracoccus liaowanqingii]|uniref:Helix-turn-helix domain-containing protein n=1 Tax=Paracoccus liaowanqingii TaxID=2560053 RepID=A0A4Z1CRS5_9RHOB|nr:helix-turn-helix domain-containing protein [Paracoccus liaowanqingii]TGN67867.1 helix-turn-helix domain-containing protein [Paracoccus liaowanqingii]